MKITLTTLFDALRLASGLTAFVKTYTDNDEALAALVAERRAAGEEVSAADVKAAVEQAHAAGAASRALLAAAEAQIAGGPRQSEDPTEIIPVPDSAGG